MDLGITSVDPTSSLDELLISLAQQIKEVDPWHVFIKNTLKIKPTNVLVQITPYIGRKTKLRVNKKSVSWDAMNQ